MSLKIFALVFVFCVGFNPGRAFSQCRDTTLEALNQEAKEKGPIQLVFFSSWCTSCQHKLQTADLGKNTYFVASFDTRKAADKVAAHFKFRPDQCIFDTGDELARQLKVAGVPAERTVGM